MNTRIPLVVLLSVLAGGSLLFAAKPAQTPPDLTRNQKVDRKLTYNLGATGLRGWIFTKAANFRDSQQGRTTTASRQILVTHVGTGTPAEGVLKVDDVILGVGGKLFADDARKSIALAITEAEKQGVLKLTRWRAGETAEVQLKLRVLGAYSTTAPFECPKSKRILADACKVLASEPLKEDALGTVNALALLATGDAAYLPKLKTYAHKLAAEALKQQLKHGMVVWDWGYKNLFLCEYFQCTNDREVLPALTAYTTLLAKGQSMYGTFGHGISERTPDGKLHGSIPPYGPVNAAGLIANLSLVTGRRCGVSDPEVGPAIERAEKFFAYFVDKGAIPYGEHAPWANHDNNGKNAMAAVMFALAGDRPVEAKYYAKMVTASFQNREYGHTGQGFSYLWGAPGANAGGPAAAAAFVREAAWHLDLVRRCDGSFTYDGGEQYGPGKTDDNTYFGKSGYYGLSPTACYVLTYALPLKKLWITGKDANPKNWLTANDVKEAVTSGHFYEQREQKTVTELLVTLGDWSPVVRGLAAEELAARPEAKAIVTQLIKLAEGPNAWQRQGACEALGHLKDPAALPVLVRLCTHPDRWLRVKAAEALKHMGDKAKPVIPDLLKVLAATATPTLPVTWDDPIQLPQGELADTVFRGLLRDSIKTVEPKLLHPAIRAIAQNPDGMARAKLNQVLAQLSQADVELLAPDLLNALQTRAPADTMFGNEIRMAAFKALAKYHYQEAIAAGVQFALTQGGHGSENRTGVIMKELITFGAAAKPAVPALKELIAFFNEQCRRREYPAGELNQRRITAVENAIQTIEAATTQPEVRSLKRRAS
jgi:HEAT repeat protein